MDLSSRIQDNTTRLGTFGRSTRLHSAGISLGDRRFCQQTQMDSNSLLDKRSKWIRPNLLDSSILTDSPRLVSPKLKSSNTFLLGNLGSQKLFLFL